MNATPRVLSSDGGMMDPEGQPREPSGVQGAHSYICPEQPIKLCQAERDVCVRVPYPDLMSCQ